ncbi:MAG: hypothetical protein ISQ08_08435 [Planctomycetes bacterium]|nr:hypothetical protein [Planctomycetota bacterium]
MRDADLDLWERHLADLGRRVARTTAPLAPAEGAALRPASQGAGDASWALDEACEAEVEGWFASRALEGPLSLLTEHHGWRHRGPDGGGGWRELDGFDHGGPRVVCDPVDGTRHLLLRHRAAWCLIALAHAGPDQPRQSEVVLAHAEELPARAGAPARRLGARRGGGAWLSEGATREPLRVDADDRLDHGFFSFFAFHPAQRPAVAQLADRVTARWAREEGCSREHCWQDDYISSGGLLLNAALGSQRVVVDARALLPDSTLLHGGTCHPYDLAAPVLILDEAGGSVRGMSGAPFDQPLDAVHAAGFLAFTNRATAARALPALLEELTNWKREFEQNP